MIKEITSTENKIYKQTKKLLNRSERNKTKMFVAEGQRIVEDAVASGAAEYLFVSQDYRGDEYDLPTYRVSGKMFCALSDTETNQGILAVCKMQEYDINNINCDTLLICDGVSDPGNLGTLIRTAECSGVGGVILLKGTVDPYSPKVVRSTMGSIFRMPLYFAQMQDLTDYLSEYAIVATVLDGSKDLYDIDFPAKTAVVVGNEAHGVSSGVADMANIRTRIPMCGKSESLNASVAGSVVMYEIFRQKRLKLSEC